MHGLTRLILTMSCPDRAGLIFEVSNFLTGRGAFILESAQYGDPTTGTFFMRWVFDIEASNEAKLRSDLESFGKTRSMEWMAEATKKQNKVVILVSSTGHCLADLLHRVHSQTLPIEVPAVISNHEKLRPLVEWYKIPFFLVASKEDQSHEKEILHIIDLVAADLVVLARYMQILSPVLCSRLRGKCINIHHSFLPSFRGAKPYTQAFDRGVKLIGATAHYVTDELDDGPIIDQEVERVDHSLLPAQLSAVGRDIEKIVLARAIRLHIERRVLINNNKTVVFR